MIDLPTYDGNKWILTNRGTGTSTLNMGDEGIVTLVKNTIHLFDYTLNKNKKYTIYFYSPEPNGGAGIGITTGDSTYVRKGITSEYGSIVGINKATIYYEDNTWKIQYNNSTPLNLIDKENTNIVFVTNQYNSALSHTILAITEKETEEE